MQDTPKRPDFKQFYYYTNQINIPTHLFVSREYNLGVVDIHISGVAESNRDFLSLLSRVDTIDEAAAFFEKFMTHMFHLDETVNGRRVNSWLRLLKGWFFDSNSSEGAVLRGWVESRFGLVPFFHRSLITGLDTREYYDYLEEKMKSRFSSNAVHAQLDLLYTYTQCILKRFFPEHVPRLTLYRGVNSLDEHMVVERYGRRRVCIEQNSLVSFSSDKDIAGQFGDNILKVEVPFTKVMFFTDGLPTRSMKGESEFIVLGGRYDSEIVPF